MKHTRAKRTKPNCIHCDILLTTNNRQMEDGRGNQTNICKECFLKGARERGKMWRKKNPEKNKEVYDRSNKKKTEQYYQVKKEYIKEIGGCQVCGYNDFSCLPIFEFHHTSKDKEYNISLMRKKIDKKEFFKEVKKCIVVCANCHRKIHYKELLQI